MSIAICNYVRFKQFTNSPSAYIAGYDFQNFSIGESRVRNGITHLFAPFGVTSGAGTRGGDRSEAAIVSPTYQLAVNLFTEACINNYLCEIATVLLDPETFSDVQTITTETWVCSRPEFNTERAVLQLASPLDAVDAQIPKRALSSVLVGNLPATGALSVS